MLPVDELDEELELELLLELLLEALSELLLPLQAINKLRPVQVNKADRVFSAKSLGNIRSLPLRCE